MSVRSYLFEYKRKSWNKENLLNRLNVVYFVLSSYAFSFCFSCALSHFLHNFPIKAFHKSLTKECVINVQYIPLSLSSMRPLLHCMVTLDDRSKIVPVHVTLLPISLKILGTRTKLYVAVYFCFVLS